MRSVWVVAQNTVKEVLRDRILYGILVLAVFLVGLSLLLGDLSFTEQERIITDLGLVAVQLSCCMLAVFVGSSLVWREIEKQTVLLLISKPVRRSQFLLGKFLGLGAVVVLADVLVSLVLALVCSFYGVIHWQQFIAAQGGILMESFFLLSLTIFFGVFARPTLTTIFVLAIWVAGHGVNDIHYFSEKSRSEVLKSAGLAFTRVFPNLDLFNFKEAVIYGDAIPAYALGRAGVLCLAWFVIFLIGAIWIFDRRDFT